MCRVKYASEVFTSLYLWFKSVDIIVKMAPGCQADLKSSLMFRVMSRLQTVAHAKPSHIVAVKQAFAFISSLSVDHHHNSSGSGHATTKV